MEPLYIKTDNSLLSSLIKIDDLIDFAIKNKIKALAITDDSMYGVLEFYLKCKKNNIKPIIGLEIADVVLYAINYEGYKARLISGQEIADIAGNPEWTPDGNYIDGLPTWLYSNMAVSVGEEGNPTFNDVYEHAVYWTDSAYAWEPATAWDLYYVGRLSNLPVSRAGGCGVRPVVKILKSNL